MDGARSFDSLAERLFLDDVWLLLESPWGFHLTLPLFLAKDARLFYNLATIAPFGLRRIGQKHGTDTGNPSLELRTLVCTCHCCSHQNLKRESYGQGMGSGRGDETKEASQMSLRAVKVETLAKVSPSTPLTKTLLDGKRQKRSRSGPKRPATLKVQMQKQLPVLPAKGGENLGRA